MGEAGAALLMICGRNMGQRYLELKIVVPSIQNGKRVVSDSWNFMKDQNVTQSTFKENISNQTNIIRWISRTATQDRTW